MANRLGPKPLAAKLAVGAVAVLGAWQINAAAATASNDDDAALPTVLPEIIVTAQKLSQNLEQVPVSVGTIDGALMQQSGATGFPDLQGYLGNVTLALSPTGGDFFIRGFGTLSTNAGFEPSVATVVDGIYYGRSNFLSVFFNDDQRMEVLRGPQGTLFGKNSTAGVFNLVTRAPDANTGMGGELLLGSDQRAVRPVFNIALGEHWAARIAGNFSRDDGLLHNTDLDRPEVDTSQNTIRGRLRYTQGPAQIDLGAFYSQQWLNANNFQLIKVTAPTEALMRDYDPQFEANLDFKNSANVPSRGETHFAGANATVDYTLDGLAGIDQWKLTSVTGWAKQTLESRDIDGDFSPVPVVRDTLIKPAPYKQFSQEVRVGGHDDSILDFGHGIDFVIGAYYFDSTFVSNDQYQLEDLGAALAFLTAAEAGNPDGNPVLRLGGVPLAQTAYGLGQLVDLLQPLIDPAIGSEQVARVSLDQETSTAALFGQMEYFVFEDWSVILGGRVGHEHKKGHFTSSHEGVFIPLVAGQEDFDSTINRSENEFSPKAGLKWQPRPNANVYLTWTRGYKSGGFNALPLNPDHLEFEPERATSLELGAKARLLQGSLRVSAALFDMRFSNLQVSTFEAGNGGGAAPVFLNAASARSRGGELEINWLAPLRGLAFYGSAGYADAYYTHYPDAPACAVPSECPNTNSDGTTQDLSGRTLSNAPRWTAAAVPSFTTLVPGGALATFAVDVLYRSGRYVDVDLAPEKYQPATTELNARVVLGSRQGNWMLSLAARNLTQEKIVDQVLDEPLAPGNYAASRSDRGRVFAANLIFDI
ncbi:TonB-dependent receptor [Solimonas marina]|uniref:TonB-dependent receptor n=1 Tax=Solimonas marina TaxID=2714601 RepID=A0A969W8F8_9GAMM|nr:TonB-dependent receptor [Solimonas marina]NKF21824.1 TonB-dependent receptor [Solimonas marina]